MRSGSGSKDVDKSFIANLSLRFQLCKGELEKELETTLDLYLAISNLTGKDRATVKNEAYDIMYSGGGLPFLGSAGREFKKAIDLAVGKDRTIIAHGHRVGKSFFLDSMTDFRETEEKVAAYYLSKVPDKLCKNCKHWEGWNLLEVFVDKLLNREGKETMLQEGACPLLKEFLTYPSDIHDEWRYETDKLYTPPSFGCILWERREDEAQT